MLSSNITVGENGHLFFGGQDAVALAGQYGTPLYLMASLSCGSFGMAAGSSRTI